MLVQKRKTSSKIIFLWLGIAVIVLIAGFLVYQNFVLTAPSSPTSTQTPSSKQLSVPTEFGEKLFIDPRYTSIIDNGTKQLGYTEQFSVTAKSGNDLAAPKTIKVFNPAQGGKLVISWSASEDAITGYSVFRSTSRSGGFANIALTSPDVTNYADTKVKNDEQYFYLIRAIKFVELERISATSRNPDADLKADPISSGGMLLSWNNPDPQTFEAIEIIRKGTDGTETPVRSAVSSGSDDASLLEAKATLADDAGVTTDTYTIIWYKSYRESAFSPIGEGKSTDTTAPTTPTDLDYNIVDNGKSIMIRWTNPLDPDFNFVRIRRSAAQGAVGDIVKSDRTLYIQDGDQCKCSIALNSGQPCETTSLPANELAPAEGDCFFDSGGISPGNTYYYTISAVDTSENESIIKIIGPYGRDNPFAPAL